MLIYSDKYRGWGKQKPSRWGPISAVKSAVHDYYENKVGVATPVYFALFADNVRNLQSVGRNIVATTVINGQWDENGLYCRNGYSDYIEVGLGAHYLTDTVGTILATINPDFSTVNNPIIFGKTGILSSGSWAGGMRMGLTSSQQMSFHMYNTEAAVYLYATGDGSVPSSKITSIAYRMQSSGLSMFIAGKSQTLNFINGNSNTVGWIGKYYYDRKTHFGAFCPYTTYVPSSNMFKGYFQAIKYSSVPLTDDQIALENAQPYGAIQPHPVPVYFFLSSGAYTLTADGGSYTLSGSDSTLLKNSVLTATAGDYAVNGQPTNLIFNRVVQADVGNYSIVGSDAEILLNRVLASGAGAYNVAGTDSSLLLNRSVSAATGNYNASGQPASLLKHSAVLAESGSYTLTGSGAGLLLNRVLTASPGGYAITGINVDLVYSGSVGPTYTLSATAGSFSIVGSDADLLLNRVLSSESGSVTLTGSEAALLFNRVIAAGGGNYFVTGIDAALLQGRVLSAETGTYDLSGQLVTLEWSGLVLPSGQISITFTAAAPAITFTAAAPAITFN